VSLTISSLDGEKKQSPKLTNMIFDILYLSFEFLIIFRIWIEKDLLLVQLEMFPINL